MESSESLEFRLKLKFWEEKEKRGSGFVEGKNPLLIKSTSRILLVKIRRSPKRRVL
jgi:hypothetical protein